MQASGKFLNYVPKQLNMNEDQQSCCAALECVWCVQPCLCCGGMCCVGCLNNLLAEWLSNSNNDKPRKDVSHTMEKVQTPPIEIAQPMYFGRPTPKKTDSSMKSENDGYMQNNIDDDPRLSELRNLLPSQENSRNTFKN